MCILGYLIQICIKMMPAVILQFIVKMRTPSYDLNPLWSLPTRSWNEDPKKTPTLPLEIWPLREFLIDAPIIFLMLEKNSWEHWLLPKYNWPSSPAQVKSDALFAHKVPSFQKQYIYLSRGIVLINWHWGFKRNNKCKKLYRNKYKDTFKQHCSIASQTQTTIAHTATFNVMQYIQFPYWWENKTTILS